MKDRKKTPAKILPTFVYAIVICAVSTAICAAAAALMISSEALPESAIPYCAGAALVIGSVIGGFRVTVVAGKNPIVLGLVYGIIVVLLWTVLHFALYRGPIQGFLFEALLILSGGVCAGSLHIKGQKGRKKRYF